MNHGAVKKRNAVARLIFIVLMTLWLCCSAYAQALRGDSGAGDANQGTGANSPYTLKRGTNELGVFGGISLNNPTLIGTVTDARLTLLALRYGRVLGTKGGMAFEYTIDAVPVAFVSEPRFVVQTTPTGALTIEKRYEAVYGAGVSPVGFKFNFRRRERVQPFASTSGGIFYFAKQVSAPGSSQFNFTFDFSGGVEIFTSPRRAVTLGYQYRHISNGGTAQFNPGLDANVIFAGFSIFR